MERELRAEDPGFIHKFLAGERILADRARRRQRNGQIYGGSRTETVIAACCVAMMIGWVLFVVAITMG
jgi:hypothetical protein